MGERPGVVPSELTAEQKGVLERVKLVDRHGAVDSKDLEAFYAANLALAKLAGRKITEVAPRSGSVEIFKPSEEEQLIEEKIGE